ncbi:MAG: hypothetical protein ACK5LC_00810 [Coprobacillaceae bacterium]
MNELKIDIGVNPKQTIIETLNILEDNNFCNIPEVTYSRIQRTNKLISILSTYEESNILEGDIITI